MHHHIYVYILYTSRLFSLYFLVHIVCVDTLCIFVFLPGIFIFGPHNIIGGTSFHIDNIQKYLMYDVSCVYMIFTKTYLLNRLANLVKTMLKHIYDHYI